MQIECNIGRILRNQGISGVLSIALEKPLVLPGRLIPAGVFEQVTIAAGVGTVDLEPSQSIFYTAFFVTAGQRAWTGRFIVPAVADTEPIDLSALLELTPPLVPDNGADIVVISEASSLTVNLAYWVDSVSLVALQLPTATDLDWLELYQAGAGGWQLQQQAGQQMRLGSVTTTLGVSGRIGSTAPGDRVRLVYRSSLNRWESTLIQGNIEVI